MAVLPDHVCIDLSRILIFDGYITCNISFSYWVVEGSGPIIQHAAAEDGELESKLHLIAYLDESP
jgi:hypothetical protein